MLAFTKSNLTLKFAPADRRDAPLTSTLCQMNPNSELLGQYRTALNRIQLAYASVVLWSHPCVPDLFRALYDKMPERVRLFPDVTRMVGDEPAMKIVCDDLYFLACRSALTDLLPISKSYCHSTGQLDKLKAQPWFTFWRILRNNFAHDMKFNFNPAERALVPVTWSGVTIDLSMNGQPLKHGQLSYAKMKDLVETAQSFLLRNVA